MDRSRGRIQVINGVVYYSPNSSRDVEVPAAVDKNKTPFILPTAMAKCIQISQTWFTVWEHFSLIQLPALKHASLSLRHIIHSNDILGCRHYDFAAGSPPSPHDFGFPKPQPYYKAMAKCIQISRTWFTVWGALLSYSIACAETRQSQSQTHHSFKQHSWMQFLASNRKTIDFHPWIDQLGASAMEAFFQQQKERNKRICQRETLTERQKRENCEQQPPTASSVVILWSHTCTGEYKSSKIMGKQQRLEHLDSYSENQKRYNAFHNEWHIC
ncbi:hypothetical protein CPB83DRAFT_730754, partial [Crepidotus variabilis]